ncbi:MAG: replication-associated recombination protein A [Firmicutes bacterium]|nr:replication-associated recombination protein A [Bacillota bacterium]
MRREGPLAYRMRPRSLGELVGQEKILGEGKPLQRMIAGGKLVSLLLYGPPGTGKTSLARIIAAASGAHFVQLNAVAAGVKEIREEIARARERWATGGGRTILFIDEIHRFNKSQQDALLAAVEEGTVILIGATTENPFFYINAPLLSRTRLVVFEKIGREDIRRLLERALEDKERGLGELSVEADPRALDYLADLAEGDARVALNALETAVLSAGSGREKIRLSLPLVQEVLPGRPLEYDREGDSHYDMASALIKSIRGSDPDAALYWMSRMLQGGEDPLFIARRLIISAAEDVGNADPRALPLAVAAAQAVQFIGMPEGRIPLAQAAAYLASAPKSNAAYLALEEALAEVERSGNQPVPSHLRDGSYRGAARLGRGRGYLYPHDYPGHYVPQLYLPEALKDKRFYRPTEQGFEKQIRERLQRLRSRGSAGDE